MKQTQWHSSKGNSCRQMTLTKQNFCWKYFTLYTWQRKRHAFRARRNGFFGGEFSVSNIREDAAGKVMFISQTTDFHFANCRFSFRKLQIFISQTTDFRFANYRFQFRKLQVPISQTTDSHFANYRFPFRKLQISISFRPISFRKLQ